MSDSLADANLTLSIIGIEPNVIVCDDFYSALAKNTGKVGYFAVSNANALVLRR
jgi:hypothetical protein